MKQKLKKWKQGVWQLFIVIELYLEQPANFYKRFSVFTKSRV